MPPVAVAVRVTGVLIDRGETGVLANDTAVRGGPLLMRYQAEALNTSPVSASSAAPEIR